MSPLSDSSSQTGSTDATDVTPPWARLTRINLLRAQLDEYQRSILRHEALAEQLAEAYRLAVEGRWPSDSEVSFATHSVSGEDNSGGDANDLRINASDPVTAGNEFIRRTRTRTRKRKEKRKGEKHARKPVAVRV